MEGCVRVPQEMSALGFDGWAMLCICLALLICCREEGAGKTTRRARFGGDLHAANESQVCTPRSADEPQGRTSVSSRKRKQECEVHQCLKPVQMSAPPLWPSFWLDLRTRTNSESFKTPVSLVVAGRRRIRARNGWPRCISRVLMSQVSAPRAVSISIR